MLLNVEGFIHTVLNLISLLLLIRLISCFVEPLEVHLVLLMILELTVGGVLDEELEKTATTGYMCWMGRMCEG